MVFFALLFVSYSKKKELKSRFWPQMIVLSTLFSSMMMNIFSNRTRKKKHRMMNTPMSSEKRRWRKKKRRFRERKISFFFSFSLSLCLSLCGLIWFYDDDDYSPLIIEKGNGKNIIILSSHHFRRRWRFSSLCCCCWRVRWPSPHLQMKMSTLFVDIILRDFETRSKLTVLIEQKNTETILLMIELRTCLYLFVVVDRPKRSDF